MVASRAGNIGRVSGVGKKTKKNGENNKMSRENDKQIGTKTTRKVNKPCNVDRELRLGPFHTHRFLVGDGYTGVRHTMDWGGIVGQLHCFRFCGMLVL